MSKKTQITSFVLRRKFTYRISIQLSWFLQNYVCLSLCFIHNFFFIGKTHRQLVFKSINGGKVDQQSMLSPGFNRSFDRPREYGG